MTHPWIGWRSIYIADPEGNVVEFVCYDQGVPGGSGTADARQA
jgi:hypothetical protein